MPKIIFVCTGNTCRSPMAERLLIKMYREDKSFEGELEVVSAGISALPGQGPNPKAVSVLKEEGIDLTDHVTTNLNREIIDSADLILTMTSAHKERIKAMVPEGGLENKLYTLKEFAGKAESDILDPFGQPLEVYKKTRDEIKENLKLILGKLNHSFFKEGKEKIVKNNNNRSDYKLKIAIGSDHAGYPLKNEVIKLLEEEGFEYIDMGTDSTESVDYPDFAYKVADSVSTGECDRGILICGTGIGMSITANKVEGIRAALCHDVFSARATRNHNNSNVLTMGSRVIGPGLAREIVRAWLGAEFDGGRHERRVNKITSIERGEYKNE